MHKIKSEKWDSLTRNWFDLFSVSIGIRCLHLVNRREHDKILSQIQLFLVDEVRTVTHFKQPHEDDHRLQVHVLNDTRGSTLEVVISRMKLRGSAVRFVLVSATAPNIDDIANWIGCRDSDRPATVFQVRYAMTSTSPF
jgi:ATP-dependent DNA helicase HFM1/MER3